MSALDPIRYAPYWAGSPILFQFGRLDNFVAPAMADRLVKAERIEKLERNQERRGSILVAVVQDIYKLKNPPTTRAIGFVARGPKQK